MPKADREALVQQILRYIRAIRADESMQYVEDRHPSVYLDEKKRLIFSSAEYKDYIEPQSGDILTVKENKEETVYDNKEYLRAKPIEYLEQASKRLEEIVEEIQIRQRPRIYMNLANRLG